MMNQRTMMMTTGLCRALLLAALVSTITAVVSAHNTTSGAPATKEAKPADMMWKVEHDHAIGEGKGELYITESGIEFKGEGKDEERHNRTWRDGDIKRLSISRNELRIVVYEEARIPLIPRKAPFSKGGKSIRNGSEHDYLFRLRDGEITPEVVSALLARFNRSIETSVIPKDEAESGRLLFEIPVFHRHRAGGRSGMLRVFETYVVFNADATGDARFWRYSDIRDIGSLGRYQFEIATYEGQFGVDGKSYIFDLKRPLTEAEYESFWTKVYASGRQTGLRPALGHQQE
ncbi:MAG: hypothetical protein ACREEM_00915 [Blastocatellia bacterium]